jgi:hypothetical protein
MKKHLSLLWIPCLVLFVFAACKKESTPIEQPVVVTAAGDVTNAVTTFKTSLGNNNTTTGVTGGHREINWDAVPDSFALNNIPLDFFNPTGTNAAVQLQRGFVYDKQGGFRVSSAGFSELKTAAIADVQAFSGAKTFANVSAPLWPAGFRVAGQNALAAVKSVGVVFVGVDLPNTSYIEPFSGEKSLGKFFAEPHSAGGKHSFVGVSFSNNIVTSVKIMHGNGVIESTDKDISNGGDKDLVALDDIIFSEPVAQ